MLASTFAPQSSLRDSSRLPAISLAAGITVAEFACLLTCGALAALAIGLLHLRLHMPGHAILRGALPMAMGLALVPRRWSGIITAIGAGATATVMSAAQIGTFPATSMLSVFALGPIMDLAVLDKSNGWRLYIRLVAAGALANLLAYALRMAGFQLSIETGGGGQLDQFTWPTLLVSYLLCGALAGFIGAVAWFRSRVDDDLRRN